MRKKNSTPRREAQSPIDYEKLNPDTTAFHVLTDRVALMVVEITRAAGSLLNWPKSIVYFLEEVLVRLAEDATWECGHAQFAEALWPQLAEARRWEKMSRRVRGLKDMMRESGFQAVFIAPRRTRQTEDGAYFGLPTLYQRRDFWKLYRAVQDAAFEPDLFALSKAARRKRIRVIVDEWLKANGCQAVIREVKAKASKKPATVSEADGAGDPQAGKRVTKEGVEARIAAVFDGLFECGQDWMSCGLSLGQLVVGLHRQVDQTELRLRDAVARSNAPGLKLIKRNGGLK